jgi:hypothetical protein
VLEVEGTAVIKFGSLVTLKGTDTRLYRVEQVVDPDRSLLRVRAVSSGKTKDVDANDIVIVADDELTAFHEAAKAKESEVEHDNAGDDLSDEHYAIALSRYKAIKKFRVKELTREELCAEFDIGQSTFYTLLKQQDLVRDHKRGNPRPPHYHLDPDSPAGDMPTSGDTGASDLPDVEVRDD